jgi:hypothetical protein
LAVFGVAYGAVLAADRSVRGFASVARAVACPALRDEREAP